MEESSKEFESRIVNILNEKSLWTKEEATKQINIVKGNGKINSTIINIKGGK